MFVHANWHLSFFKNAKQIDLFVHYRLLLSYIVPNDIIHQICYYRAFINWSTVCVCATVRALRGGAMEGDVGDQAPPPVGKGARFCE